MVFHFKAKFNGLLIREKNIILPQNCSLKENILKHFIANVYEHANKLIIVRPCKSSENMRKEDGPDRPVSNNKFPLVTLNELTLKARESIL